MRKPIIGVVPLWDDDRASIWMIPGYMDLIRESGGVPIILPLTIDSTDLMQVCQMCDGFLLTGGHDVDPAIYGEIACDRCGVANRERDLLEHEIFNYAMQYDIPLLGVCRGIQFINAICGGTLYQDLPTEHLSVGDSGYINHQMDAPYDRPWHRVNIISETPLSTMVKRESLMVNSYHHQAIKSLAPSLCAMALSDDGLVEAIYHPNKRFIQAVQWHPELNYQCEDSSRLLMRIFCEECQKSKQ